MPEIDAGFFNSSFRFYLPVLMPRKFFIWLALSLSGAIVALIWDFFQERHYAYVRSLPQMYAYFKTAEGRKFSILAADNLQDLDSAEYRMKKESHKTTSYRIYWRYGMVGLDGNKQVYVFPDTLDGRFVRIGYFYLSASEIEKYFEGYVPSYCLHTSPLTDRVK